MSADKDILFYILVPVYKVEKYIKECIESVLNQTNQNFRLILVDDGSPDAAGQICDEFAHKDMRLHVIHQKNMGLVAARDTAINYIQASCCLDNAYVIFLDSDDTLKVNALERIADIIRQENCDMVIYGMDRVSDGHIVSPFDKGTMKSHLEKNKRDFYKKVFFKQDYNALCRKAVRATLLPQKSYEKYYKISYGEDLLRSLNLYKSVSTVFFLQESLYNYTINPESITRSINSCNFKVDFTIREQVNEFLRSDDVFTLDDWAEYRGFCASSINKMAISIGCFPISAHKKRMFYNEIAESNYYKKNLHGKHMKCSAKDKVLFCMFDHKIYCFFNIYGILRKYYSKMKIK